MNDKHPILLVVAAVAVTLSTGHSIKEPGPLTASFSRASSSASAFSHASSSSYSFNGNDVTGLNEALKAQAVASASAGAFATAQAGAVAGSAGSAGSGASGGPSGSNAIGGSSASADNGAYKGIEADKYQTDYPSGSKTNYAVSSNYVQGSQYTAGNCASCKGPFPGPNGSIHDYKPASSVPKSPSAIGISGGAHAAASAGANAASYQQPAVVPNEFPGSTGNIYTSKPSGQYSTASGSGHVSPSLIASLPGAAGSIHDSKPAGAVSGAGAAAGAVAQSGIASSHPAPALQRAPIAGPGLTQIISVLPGSSGSIYDSKPAAAGSGASSGSYSTGSSVSNVPSAHPVVGPTCSYAPGSSNKCGSGSVTNIPSSHPVVGPTCSYAPGSPNKCGSGSPSAAGPVTDIPVVGPACSYAPGSPSKCGGAAVAPGGAQYYTGAGSGASAQAGAGGATVSAPSIHPQVPSSGTYYINKEAAPSLNVEPPHISAAPSFTGQIPCSGASCGTIPKGQAPQQGDCGFGSSCGAQGGSQGSSFSGSHSSGGSGIVYENKDKSDYYQNVNHDKAHISGGIVYENDDGSYNAPTTGKATYKNAANGGHAVSSNSADNTGFLVGPGTGHLPIEADAKPFGTQGAFGGSAAFAKETAKLPFGGSAAFSQGSAGEQSSAISQSGQVSIQKVDGIEVESAPCATATCGSGIAGSDGNSGSYGDGDGFATGQVVVNKGGDAYDVTNHGNAAGNGFATGQVLGDSGPSGLANGAGFATGQVLVNKGDSTHGHGNGDSYSSGSSGAGSGFATGQVLVNKEGSTHGHGNGDSYSSGSSGAGSGFATGQVLVNKEGSTHGHGNGDSYSSGSSGAGSGFATGQVLVNKGDSTYDVTNSGSAHQAGTYSGCHTGLCGGNGFAVGGSFAIPSPGGLLNKLFGAGGLSGTDLNRVGGSSGGYAGASSGSFASASAGASASAHAGSFAGSF